MTVVAYFSTDWSREPVEDKIKSALTGRTYYVPDKQTLTYGGTYYYRMAMPGMELNKHGYDNFLSWQIDSAPDGHLRAMDTEGNWHDPDVVVLQRHMGETAAAFIQAAKATGQQVWNDLDDSFAKLPKSNIAHQTTDPIKNPHFNRDHYYKAIAASTAVTVSTPALYKEVERLGVPVYLCRNAIDIERWPQLDPGTEGAIGWIGGIQWRANDMKILKQFLPAYLEDVGATWYHGGDSQIPEVDKAWEQVGIDRSKVRCISAPLCHISEYPKLFGPLNISLIPLEDCYFNHAKSTLKQLESSASGLPYIVSDLPEQKWFANDGGMGRLAKNHKPRTWEDHLDDLLEPEVRRTEGAANRKHAEQFNIADKWIDWDNAYRDMGVKP